MLIGSMHLLTPLAPTYTHTLSLHDALPICVPGPVGARGSAGARCRQPRSGGGVRPRDVHPEQGHPVPAGHRRRSRRSEEHTSELQSRGHLVCRLLLEKKKTTNAKCSIWYSI